MGNIFPLRRSHVSLEEENFVRFGNAIIEVGSSILQQILELYIPSKDIASKVTPTIYYHILKKLDSGQKHLISQASTDGYTNFDITLCYTLLRNVFTSLAKPTRGWGKQPLDKDTTLSDDIERLRFLRNEMYGHLAHSSIPITQFTNSWEQLKGICSRMKVLYPNGRDFPKELGKWESCIVTRIQWSNLVEIVQKSREHDEAIDDHNRRITIMEQKQISNETRVAILDNEIQRHVSTILGHDGQLSFLDKGVKVHDKVIHEHTGHITSINDSLKRHGTLIDRSTELISSLDTGLKKHGTLMEEHAGQIASIDTEVKTQGVIILNQADLISNLDSQYQLQQDQIGDIRKQIETEVNDSDTGRKLDVQRLKENLITINNREAEVIPATPFQEDGDTLPIELLYASVVIREDFKYTFCREHSTNKAQSKALPDITFEDRYSDDSSETEGVNQESIATSEIHVTNTGTRDHLALNTESSESTPNQPNQDSISSKESSEDYGEESYDLVVTPTLNKKVTDTSEIFSKSGQAVRNIYMLGDAAHGKTTYCLWIVKKWCDAHSADCFEDDHRLTQWEETMQAFDFVFLLQLRGINPNRTNVIDMICQDLFGRQKDCHATIRHVLSSVKYRILIIIDGLDEWNPNEEARKQLTFPGMPNIEGVSSSVTCFISMRPWVFSVVSKLIRSNDRVLEIKGLSEKGIRKIIKNVLSNYYMVQKNSSEYRNSFLKIIGKLKDKNLRSFMKIPLLAVVCVQIWYSGRGIANSLTSFYAVMIDMLIERASEKHDFQSVPVSQVDCNLPTLYIEDETENLLHYMSIMLKLGKVAYEGLVSYKGSLVFQKRKLKKEIGADETQFALDIGLISQKGGSSATSKSIKVIFFHKSIQEFLAAIYVVSKGEVTDSFCKYLSNAKTIMEFSNVIRFICGISPSFGSAISQRVVDVIGNDAEMLEYREAALSNYPRDLYKLQANWYRELQHGQAMTDERVPFHISDICVVRGCDRDMANLTRETLSNPESNLRSLKLHFVKTSGQRGISCTVLNEFLKKVENKLSLTTLYICGGKFDRFVQSICGPSLQTLHLIHLKIMNPHFEGDVDRSIFRELTSLRRLHMNKLTFDENGLELPSLPVLQHLELHDIILGMSGVVLPNFSSLITLKLNSLTIKEKRIYLPKYPLLRSLEISGMKIGEKGLVLPTLPTLEILTLYYIPTDEGEFELPNLPSLQSLNLHGIKFHNLGEVLDNIKFLENLKLYGVTLGDKGLNLSNLSSLQNLEFVNVSFEFPGQIFSSLPLTLRKLELLKISLDDRQLCSISGLVKISNIIFTDVSLSRSAWQDFIHSLQVMDHGINVELTDTNLDQDTKTKICSSPQFVVTRNDYDDVKHPKDSFEHSLLFSCHKEEVLVPLLSKSKQLVEFTIRG